MRERKLNRLKNYDYSAPGFYFITICTQNRKCFFGEIVNQELILNNIGSIAKSFWEEIPDHFPESIIDEFVIMPNHIHGIIQIIDQSIMPNGYINFHQNNPYANMGNISVSNPVGHADLRAQRDCIPRIQMRSEQNQIADRTKMTIPKIVHGFKSSVTRMINENYEINFQWQKSYYDRIIRNERELFFIRRYIQMNPQRWIMDRFY